MERSHAARQNLLRRVAAAVSDQPRVVFAYVFGSQARGSARVDSDTDVAVFLSPPPSPEERLTLVRELLTALGRELRADRVDRIDALLGYLGRLEASVEIPRGTFAAESTTG